jgi:hypothetical protein
MNITDKINELNAEQVALHEQGEQLVAEQQAQELEYQKRRADRQEKFEEISRRITEIKAERKALTAAQEG